MTISRPAPPSSAHSFEAPLLTGLRSLEAPTVPVRHRGWQLPGGRGAAERARRAIGDVLRAWELDPVADEIAGLVKQLVGDLAARGRGPLALRLELHEAAHLLLGYITDEGRARRAEPTPAAHLHTAMAVTYGRRRTARDGTSGWYTHAFTW